MVIERPRLDRCVPYHEEGSGVVSGIEKRAPTHLVWEEENGYDGIAAGDD